MALNSGASCELLEFRLDEKVPFVALCISSFNGLASAFLINNLKHYMPLGVTTDSQGDWTLTIVGSADVVIGKEGNTYNFTSAHTITANTAMNNESYTCCYYRSYEIE